MQLDVGLGGCGFDVAAFDGVFIQDSTTITLPEALAERERYCANPGAALAWGAFKKEMRGNLLGRITADPAVMVGKPVIRGMRISVAQIVAAVAAGVPRSELLEDYPGLEPDDIQAALLYAANLVEEERVYRVLQPA